MRKGNAGNKLRPFAPILSNDLPADAEFMTCARDKLNRRTPWWFPLLATNPPMTASVDGGESREAFSASLSTPMTHAITVQDWIGSAGFLAAAWSLAAQRDALEKTDLRIVGAIRNNISIPWALDSISPSITRIIFALLLLYAAPAVIAGIAAPMTGGIQLLCGATLPLVGAFQYCRRPHYLSLGTLGFSWHGQSYGWHEVSAHIDRDRKLLHFRVLPNGTTRPYGAFKYIHLTTVSAESMGLLDSIVAGRYSKQWTS